mmetsp:Transcript_46086/g.99853  ORF Transcript_46086/g.99853 Transcript_46086/m.99853 type:complete len:489 (-) Transcript_46086:86-1552(-)
MSPLPLRPAPLLSPWPLSLPLNVATAACGSLRLVTTAMCGVATVAPPLVRWRTAGRVRMAARSRHRAALVAVTASAGPTSLSRQARLATTATPWTGTAAHAAALSSATGHAHTRHPTVATSASATTTTMGRPAACGAPDGRRVLTMALASLISALASATQTGSAAGAPSTSSPTTLPLPKSTPLSAALFPLEGALVGWSCRAPTPMSPRHAQETQSCGRAPTTPTSYPWKTTGSMAKPTHHSVSCGLGRTATSLRAQPPSCSRPTPALMSSATCCPPHGTMALSNGPSLQSPAMPRPRLPSASSLERMSPQGCSTSPSSSSINLETSRPAPALHGGSICSSPSPLPPLFAAPSVLLVGGVGGLCVCGWAGKATRCTTTKRPDGTDRRPRRCCWILQECVSRRSRQSMLTRSELRYQWSSTPLTSLPHPFHPTTSPSGPQRPGHRAPPLPRQVQTTAAAGWRGPSCSPHPAPPRHVHLGLHPVLLPAAL